MWYNKYIKERKEVITMFKKIAFIMMAAQKAQEMTETEWKVWVMKAAKEAGYTAEEIAEALFH